MPRAPRAPKPDNQTPENAPDPSTLPPVTGGEGGDSPAPQYVGSEGEVLATREDVAADLATRPRNELDVIAETMELSVPDGTSDDDLRALILANLAFADDVTGGEGDGEASEASADSDVSTDSTSPYVLVRATSDEGRVVLFERDSLHPDGEAFIVSDGREVLVGESWGVLQAIRAGTIERV